MPHPLALFSLAPRGERAKSVISNPLNQHLVSTLNHQRVLDVGHVRSKESNNSNTLVTLGRDADICLEGRSISKIHCSFEIDAPSKVVMFYDRSHTQTSQVFGANAIPFIPSRSRKVVVQQDLNTIIGMGGEKRDHYQFELHWHTNDEDELKEQIKSREVATLEENPRFARTVDAADTVLPSRRETRIHTPQQPTLRYHTMETLGAGQFGDVQKAVDVDTGLIMAVKLIRRPPAVASDEHRRFVTQLKREVETLASCQHVSTNPLTRDIIHTYDIKKCYKAYGVSNRWQCTDIKPHLLSGAYLKNFDHSALPVA